MGANLVLQWVKDLDDGCEVWEFYRCGRKVGEAVVKWQPEGIVK